MVCNYKPFLEKKQHFNRRTILKKFMLFFYFTLVNNYRIELQNPFENLKRVLKYTLYLC